MKKENVFIGTIKKYDKKTKSEIIDEEDVILIKISHGYIKLDNIYNSLTPAFSLLHIGLQTYPTTYQEFFIDNASLKPYYPEEERHQKLSLKKLKNL